MKSVSIRNLVVSLNIVFLFLVFQGNAYSQETTKDAEQIAEEAAASKLQIQQLNDLVKSLTVKRSAREIIQKNMEAANADDIPFLQESLDELNTELQESRDALEQIAVGSVDLDIFEEDDAELDWRTELTQVMMPFMQNLKRLTEKPRRIESLKAQISQANVQKNNAELAANNIESTLSATEEPGTVEALQLLKDDWSEQADDFAREIDVANVRLNNLQRSDGSILIRIRDGLLSFIKGRGLTLLIAVIAVVLVHNIARLIAKVFSKRQKGEDVRAFRTRERIIHFALKAAKTLITLIVVIVVFYARGDFLLMALAFIVTAGIILSLRNTIPQFLEEFKLLLNLGSVREDERVMYQGLPWKVTQMNMYSVLKNPEITGIHRVPMREMMELTSRPAGKEPWFPASKGDYIVLDDGRLLEVIKITPEHVLLDSLAGTKTMIPTAEFYGMVFENLSRSPTYFVSTVFGIGYSHQNDSVSLIPERLKKALEQELEKSDISDHVVSVSAELQEAGASSLDFWIGVKMKTEAATSYFKLKRLMQQVCVSTCTQEEWDIPFPQLTLHN